MRHTECDAFAEMGLEDTSSRFAQRADDSIRAYTGHGTYPGTSDLPLYADTRGVRASPGKLSESDSYEGKTNYRQALPVEAGRTQAAYLQSEVHPTGERQLSGRAIVDALHGWQGSVYSADYNQDRVKVRGFMGSHSFLRWSAADRAPPALEPRGL